MANNETEKRSNKKSAIEKRNQEIARRKAEAEAREKERLAKRKKRIVIIVVAAALVVALVCGITIPVVIAQRRQYMEVNFSTLPVPTTVAEAQNKELVKYNHRKVKLEGYTYACTSKYYVLCKTSVSGCPYVAGTVPNNGVRMEMADGSHFNVGNNVRVRIYARMEINTLAVETFENLETYMYLVVDKIEKI